MPHLHIIEHETEEAFTFLTGHAVNSAHISFALFNEQTRVTVWLTPEQLERLIKMLQETLEEL
jgi:hypothetical protein